MVVVFKGDFVFSSSSLEFVMQVFDWFGLTSLGLGPQLPDLLGIREFRLLSVSLALR